MDKELKKPKQSSGKPPPNQSAFERGRKRFGSWMGRPLPGDGGDYDDCA